MINIVMFKNQSGDAARPLFYVTEKTSTYLIESAVKRLVGDDYDEDTDTLYGHWIFQTAKHLKDV